MANPFRALLKEKRYQQKLKPQIQERQAYNKMQRGKKLKPAERQSARSFIAKGMPKVRWR